MFKVMSIFNQGITIHERLEQTQNRPSGFDYLRLILAASVILFHTVVTSYGADSQVILWSNKFWRGPMAFVLPMFFALSGFLVAGSLERSRTLITFLGLRIFRIIPALACEVLLSALVLGPIFTTLPLPDYFVNNMFHAYFLNILGDIHYTLPGVFTSNPLPERINGQLWTIPYELLCYITLAAFFVLGIFKKRSWLLMAFIGCYVVQIINTIFRARDAVGPVGGPTLVVMFIAGIFIYRFRDKIKYNDKLLLLSAVVALFLLYIPCGDRFAALPIAYITAYIGLMNPTRNKILLSGDYSYGLYLYGYPLQQAFVALAPGMHEWYYNIIFVMPVACVIAVMSWWLVEKPVLNQRQYLKDLERWWLTRIQKV